MIYKCDAKYYKTLHTGATVEQQRTAFCGRLQEARSLTESLLTLIILDMTLAIKTYKTNIFHCRHILKIQRD